MTTYKPVQFITLDETQKTRTVWAEVDDEARLHQGIRYLLNSSNRPEEFYIYEPSSDRAIRMTDAARLLKVDDITCHDPYTMMLLLAPAELDSMTDDQVLTLKHCWDFEPYKLHLIDGKVHTVDTISNDVYDVVTPEEFIRQTIEYAREEA